MGRISGDSMSYQFRDEIYALYLLSLKCLMNSPISNFSTDDEQRLEAVYPSIACTTTGKFLGKLYESLPHMTPRVRLSYLVWIPPTWPIAIVAYLWLKVQGVRYVVATSGVVIETILTRHIVTQIPWSEVTEIEVDPASFQSFYRSSDIVIRSRAAAEPLRLHAVPFAERFSQLMQEAYRAAQATARAQEQISNRARARQLASAVPPQE
ncbi:hypothetical protein A6X21_08250 [Planctopirus hydrillae]|uniref:Uncharacterized protein n=2 Tax=Planctopirus hydrillae TaxID=1841610 RepID=A0A1C3E914_9PLAN|nr:hypothetical protein A6X21_08250 [Planctopirus hydrillae]